MNLKTKNLKNENSSKKIEQELHQILLQQPIDLSQLRSYSRKIGGYQTNQLRARIWPKLLGINRFTLVDYRNFVIRPHKDENQIRADVERSLWNHEPMKFWKESHRERRREVLAEMMMAILSKNKHLHYYQGFHDLVTTVLTVVEDDPLAFAISEYISLNYVSDYMRENFELVSKFMQFLFVIIKSQDPELFEHLEKARMEPFFAISWLITWFSHDVKDIEILARMFDALLASPPLFCFYLCAVYVIHLRDFILKAEADFATIHDVLIKAPHKYGFPFEMMLEKADKLFLKLPFTSVLPLCDRNLFKIITCNRILLFEKTKIQLNSVDSDWKLLENMKLSKWDNLQYWRYSIESTWKWSLSLLPLREEDGKFEDEINNKRDQDSNAASSRKMKRRKSISIRKTKTGTTNTNIQKIKSPTAAQTPAIVRRRRKLMRSFSVPILNLISPFNEDSDFGDDESPKHSLFTVNRLFWCITIVVSSVLGYFLVSYRIETIRPNGWSIFNR